MKVKRKLLMKFVGFVITLSLLAGLAVPSAYSSERIDVTVNGRQLGFSGTSSQYTPFRGIYRDRPNRQLHNPEVLVMIST